MSTCTRCVQRLSSSSPRKVAVLRALNGMALRVLNSMAARNTKPLPRSILTSEGQGPRDGHGLLEGLVQRPVRVRGRGGLDTMVRGLKQVTRVGTDRNDNRRATLQRNGRRDGSAFLLGRQTMTMAVKIILSSETVRFQKPRCSRMHANSQRLSSRPPAEKT